MGVALSAAGAKKLQAIAKWYDQRKTERGGQAVPAGAAEETMWGYLTGCDLSGRRHSFIRVVPDASEDDPDIIVDGGNLKYSIVPLDPPHLYSAFETNGGRESFARLCG